MLSQACVILCQGYILKNVVQIEIAQIIEKVPIQNCVPWSLED